MDDNTKTIPLTQGHVAIVDADDYDDLSQYKWHVNKNSNTFYAQRKQNGKTIKMHRQILNAPDGLLCDHKNHNGLDNRRSNLRLCTHAQNQQNRRPLTGCSSKYKGVCWNRDKKKWQADITVKGWHIFIGYFDYEADAAIAYDDRAIEYFGEFAWLNCQYRPELNQWIEDCYLFCPTDSPEPTAKEIMEPVL